MSKVIKSKIETSIEKFVLWQSEFGELSYDRMDFWSSNTGIKAKKLFYKNKVLGVPLAIWGLLLENFFPNIQKLYNKPHREVIGDGHLASGYFNLFEVTSEDKYLKRGEHFLKIMGKNYSNGYSGYAWGYSFGWQTQNGYWEAGIPLITITPYAFWAFKKHYELTGDRNSLEVALSIADFALKDIPKQKMPNGTFCYSYSPLTKDIVINANSYRAALLCDAFKLSGNEEYLKSANESIEFVLSYQGKNGEWYYEAKPPQDNFIDNFHTCFVLRNLYRCYTVNNDKAILGAIKKGYQYYRENLFYKNGRPKHFSKAKYAKLRKYEMYDYAEGITLGILLKDEIDGSFEKSVELAEDLINNFQTSKGHFITRVTSLGTIHKVPYLRWPQAQLFYALTSLLKEIKD